MRYYILKQEDDPDAFVEFWARRYNDTLEPMYLEIYQQPLKPDSIRRLFAWKAMRINRKSIEEGKHPYVEKVIENFERFLSLPLKTSEDTISFLTNELT